MAPHHLAHRCQIRRAAGRSGKDLADLTEVGGSEDAWGRDREELRIDAAAVIKPVDLAARHADCLAWTDLDRLSVDRPRRDTFEAVDRLLKAVVAMGRRHPRVGGDVALEHRCGPVRVRGRDQEADAERAYGDGLVARGWTLARDPQLRKIDQNDDHVQGCQGRIRGPGKLIKGVRDAVPGIGSSYGTLYAMMYPVAGA